MKSCSLFIIFLVYFNTTIKHRIYIKIENLHVSNATLSLLECKKLIDLDTIISTDDRNCQFNRTNNNSGFYRLSLTNRKCVPIAVADELLQRKAKEQVDEHLG